jgi:hypothetical protein
MVLARGSRRGWRVGALVFSSLLLARCSLSTAPEEVEEFVYTGLEQPETIQESVDARAFADEVVFVGQLRTPHACFELRPELEADDVSLTLRISGRSRNDQCPTQPGAYRYNGVVTRVPAGSYDFHIVHAVPGQPERRHTFPIRVQ